ncbi:MAG: efflux RND transporter permease subunit [Planctomycetota bacterium]
MTDADASPMHTADPGGRRGGLFALFVDRPVLTLMVAMTLFALGTISFLRLPLRFVPEGLTENRIRIFVPIRQDMAPKEVQDKVLEPLEELLRTIPGVKELRSDAGSGRAFVSVTLDEGMDPTLAAAEVRDRAQRAKQQWPAEVDRYFTWKEDASNIPLCFFQVLTPERNPEWDHLIEDVVRPRLEAVEGVGRVDMWGSLSETLRIWFDKNKLAAHNVRFRELVQRLRADNFTEPLGEIDNGSERLLVRVDGKFNTISDVENFPVQTGLRLGDIARIEMVPSVRDRLARYNQKYTYSGMVNTAAGISPVDASANLHAELARLEEDKRLADVEFRFLFDQGATIRDSLRTLVSTALQGGALAIVVLWFFLRNLRFTLAIALAIPLALLIVGAQMFFAGDSLNVLSMAGMTLAIGMVVDNSVVVLENIRRHRELGQGLREACISGVREVALAVLLATLTTVVVFAPMIFMTANPQARVIFGSVGIPLSIALLGSLAVALLLLPSGAYHLGRLGGGLGREVRGGKISAALSRLNGAVLHWALSHRVLTTILGVVFLSLMVVPQKRLDFDGGGGGMFRSGDVTVNLELPRGLTLGAVVKEIEAYENFLLARKAEWHIDSIATSFDRRSARVDIKLDEQVRKKEFTQYRDAIEKAWPRRPGVEVKLANRGGSQDGGGGSEESSERNFVLRLFGRDSTYLVDLATAVRDELAQLPTVASVEIPAMKDSEEVQVRIQRDRLAELQVQPEVLFGTISSGLQGQLITNFEDDGREIRVIAEFDNDDRNPTLLDLKETEVFANTGTFQRLADLGEIRFERSMAEIERTDGKTSITIVGKRQDGVGPKAFSEDLARVMRHFPLPRGYSWSEDSVFRKQEEEMQELLSAGALSVTLVFLLMGILFESVILPGAILVTIPFAVLGALWSLLLFHGSYDPMAVIGIILLAGVVVNNGIVLLDCIERMRREGRSRHDAIVEGVRVRTRPIMMTAATTIVGLLPMAVFGESTGQGISYVSMSIAVAGGLALSTLFTAWAVPVAYTFLDDFACWLRRVWQKAVGRSTALVETGAPVAAE